MHSERLIRDQSGARTGGDGTISIRLPLERVIESFRLEVVDYGEMLVLLEEQQRLIEERSAGGLLQNMAALKRQTEVIAENRRRRNELTGELALLFAASPGASFGELMRYLPGEYQPLLRALLEEINDLLSRCQQRVMINNLMLACSARRPVSERVKRGSEIDSFSE